MQDNPNDGKTLAGSPPEHARDRAERLRAALRLVGSARAVAAASGVPFGTLQNYLSGGEMKLSNALALAAATGVRLEWLATGQGPMRAGEGLMQVGGAIGESAAAPPAELAGFAESSPAGVPLGLAWHANRDRLGAAYEKALGALAAPPGQRLDPKLLMMLTLAIYDAMTEEAARASGRLRDP